MASDRVTRPLVTGSLRESPMAKCDSDGRLLCRCPDCGKEWTATPLQTEAMLKAMGIARQEQSELVAALRTAVDMLDNQNVGLAGEIAFGKMQALLSRFPDSVRQGEPCTHANSTPHK